MCCVGTLPNDIKLKTAQIKIEDVLNIPAVYGY